MSCAEYVFCKIWFYVWVVDDFYMFIVLYGELSACLFNRISCNHCILVCILILFYSLILCDLFGWDVFRMCCFVAYFYYNFSNVWAILCILSLQYVNVRCSVFLVLSVNVQSDVLLCLILLGILYIILVLYSFYWTMYFIVFNSAALWGSGPTKWLLVSHCLPTWKKNVL